MNNCRSMRYVLWILLVTIGFTSSAQEKFRSEFSGIGIPVVDYSPETNWTIGGGMVLFGKLYDDSLTTNSSLVLVGKYLTSNGWDINANWSYYTPGNKYWMDGILIFKHLGFRNYGIGNDANAQVAYFGDSGPGVLPIETNYLEFTASHWQLKNCFLRRYKNIYFGPNLVLNKIEKYKVKEGYQPLESSADEFRTTENGWINGIGAMLRYDSRDNVANPLNGSFAVVQAMQYHRFLGSDHELTFFQLDYRKFFNFYKDQTFAFRVLSEFRFSKDRLPFFEMAKVGGGRFGRGYWKGTFQDQHIIGFQGEYRIPLWNDPSASIWQFWKHLGIVAFAQTSQVFGNNDAFDWSGFRSTAGLGLRVSCLPSKKVNLRVDFGFSFDKEAGLGMAQPGIYLDLGETF